MAKRSKPKRKFSGQLLIWDVPPELKRAFKIACHRRDTTMRRSVLNFMEGAVDAARSQESAPKVQS